jgi:hypothetical protein
MELDSSTVSIARRNLQGQIIEYLAGGILFGIFLG